MTVVDFPCAIAECCDVQLDYSIRNNEVQSCDITSALCACASSTCTRAIQRMRYTRVDLLRHTFLVTICVTSRLMKFLVHMESRLQSPDVPSPPPSERLARETKVTQEGLDARLQSHTHSSSHTMLTGKGYLDQFWLSQLHLTLLQIIDYKVC